MDVNFAPEDEAFRAEVRGFIEENYPKNLDRRRPWRFEQRGLFWRGTKFCTREVGLPQAGRKNLAARAGA